MSVKLYHGDCLEILKTLPAGSVDAVVTDPPYGVGFKYSEYDDNRHEHQKKITKWHAEMTRVSRGWVGVSCGIKNIWMWPPAHWVLCWHKNFSVNPGPFGSNNWEPVLVYGKGKRGERQSDYFEATFVSDKTIGSHPCPKPVRWAIGCSSILSKPKQTVLDPFMGSGTTGIACIKTGRNFIGIEIDRSYFQIAEKRIRKAEQEEKTSICSWVENEFLDDKLLKGKKNGICSHQS